jgi:hypothetical protein
VTASFSPASISGAGSATLTLAASAAAAAGSSTITVTGTSGALSHAATLGLTVTAAPQADFSLAVAPASLALNAGSPGSASISIGASNGFSADVALTASGAPSGVSVSFDHATVHGQGTALVTVATTASAAAGSYSVTLTGTSGSLQHTAALGVTVTAPPPSGVVFSDDAEHGNIGWITSSRHSGDPLWSIEATASGHRWRSNAGRNYADNTATFLISPSFSLAGATQATLKFLYKFHTETYYDTFYVWASGDNGKSWTQLASGSGVSRGWNQWAPAASIDLSKFAGKAKVRIAFSLQSDYSVTDWGAALDDISVTAQ